MNAVLVWALYDFANTFFAIAMLSFHFPVWVIERGGKEIHFSIALGLSMALVALLMPLCGAIADATAGHMRYLRWTTYACVATTALIGFIPNLTAGLVLFGIANMGYQLGTVFYDSLLWRIAGQKELGQVSGTGAAFGYLGSMAGLVLLWPFARSGGSQATFMPSAALFLLFALPSFLAIKETPQSAPFPLKDLIRSAILRLSITVRAAKSIKGLWRFLWAAFFTSNAINTILVFMAVYTKKALGFTQRDTITFFLFGQACAVAGAFIGGRLIPRFGARNTLIAVWCGWAAALSLLVMNPSRQLLWAAGPVIGFCLGPTWSTSRVLITEIAPKDQLAELLGLAGLFARASSILGPLMWGILVLDAGHYREAILVLIGLLAVGITLLAGTDIATEKTA